MEATVFRAPKTLNKKPAIFMAKRKQQKIVGNQGTRKGKENTNRETA